MAQRVGPAGEVVGVDYRCLARSDGADYVAPLGAPATPVHSARPDSSRSDPPGSYDLVYARLLVFHLPQRVEVLRRLWDAVAPGDHLVVQDYDFRAIGAEPPLRSVQEIAQVMAGAFEAVGCDVRAGARLPLLFAQAGIGAPTAPMSPDGSARSPRDARCFGRR